jgi:alpha-methylacyl-CoA racemase
VVVVALEFHFAAALCAAAGLPASDLRSLFKPETHAAIAAFLRSRTRKQLDRLAVEKDIPLHTLA